MRSAGFRHPRWLLTVVLAFWGTVLFAEDDKSGYRPAAYAIRGATIHAGPDALYEPGTVVVRNGIVEAAGPADKTAVPFDAEVIDGKGLHVYPGLLDLYTSLGQPPDVVRSQTGPGRALDLSEFASARTPVDNRHGLTPEFEVGRVLELPASLAAEKRNVGFTALVAAPAGAIATGQSVLVSLSGLPRREAVIQAPVALHVNLRPPFQPRPAATGDQDGATRPTARPSGRTPFPVALMGAVAHLRQAMLDAERAHALGAASEKGGTPRPPVDPALEAFHAARTKALPVWWEANTRDEIHRALDLAEEFGTSAVIVGGQESSQVVDRLKALDVPVVLRLDFPPEPRVPEEADYRKRELSDREAPLKVLRDRHARWQERIATPAALAKAGVRFAFASDGQPRPDAFFVQLRRAIAAGLASAAAVDALTQRAAEIAGVGSRLGTLSPGKLGHVIALSAPIGEESAQVRYVLVHGLKFERDGLKASEPPAPKPAPAPPATAASTAPPTPKNENAPSAGEDRKPDPPFVDVAAELEADRQPSIHTGGNVLIRDATILTVTKGTIPKGSILVREGKIAEIGEGLQAPKDTVVIEAAGMVVMPGIIDTHSHIAIDGNINEYSLSVVPEVRVKDVVSGTDPALYRALAGGTTTARLLHGSADVIGGQDAVIKLKHGLAGRDLVVKDATQGVKLALGENVTRHPGRFPNSRMGVEATLERAFAEARAYQAEWREYEANKSKHSPAIPPRRDLRLEAVGGILDGSIRIACHSYRGDEILMLLRLCVRHGVQIGSLHHALEGYKVAPEIAASGAGVSTFADWWAYKVEAFDAIPYNAALLTRAGVRVSVKSDSAELMRHLYLEAAKAVKYGNVTEDQALAMITINPAHELGLDKRLGSIEKGKDADLAIFNAHPLDGFARCEMTLVDGEVWFQRRSKNGQLTPRAGDHFVMPAPSHGLRERILEIVNNPKGVYALVGAKLHPIGGDDIRNGTLVVSEGKIVAIGGAGTRIPGAAQTIDVQGFDVWPGLVAAGTPLGLYEVGSLGETQDWADSARYQPELRASSALRADSELIPVTRANGILSAYVQPLGGTFCGQGCAIDLDGWVPREMLLADPIALHVRIPDAIPPPTDGTPSTDRTERVKKRSAALAALTDQFKRALAYDSVRAEAAARSAAAPPPDLRLAALVPYAKGERPVVFHASRRAEILDALTIAGELKLKAIISGGLDAWKVADALKAAKASVLLAGTLQIPDQPTDPYDASFTNPLRLFEAGVPFAIRPRDFGPEQATAPRNLPYEAAVAAAYGLPETEALKAVTINPARIVGIDSQVGSLEVGKRANIVVTAGHILQPTTRVKALFINGKPIAPESRHTRLYDKYLQRLAEVQAGTAPLGLEPRVVPPVPATAADPPR